MRIYGLQKMTLLDFPGKVAATVFTGGCDLRCPFCHNFELAEATVDPIMDEGELYAFLQKRKGLLDGVAFTGGEPCLQAELPDILREVRKMGYAVKLDTNGCHPRMLSDILEEGLVDYVAMDIKNSKEKYAMTSGLDEVDLERVSESIALIMEKAADYEFRTTVVKEYHKAGDFDAIGAWIRGARRYFLQSFTDRDTVPRHDLHAATKEELEEYARRAGAYVREVALRGVE